jgi:ABC-type lipoprotein release transport system permease subunit
VALALAAVAFAACALPARRASRIDPTLALAE